MSHYARWRARLARLLPWKPLRPAFGRVHAASADNGNAADTSGFSTGMVLSGPLKLLVVVEGVHDIEFLRRISGMLHAHEPRLPDLRALEHRGALVFVPFGGSDLKLWVHRLSPLNKPEIHIYDREEPPETEVREQLAGAVNQRPGCLAVVTAKRTLENYLHPAAIREAGGVDLEFGDDDPVADLIAQRVSARERPDEIWQELPRRTKTRRRNRVKHWLNRSAAERMTPERLAEQDPQGEVRSWLESMLRLMAECRDYR
jgi:hypothetical protein